jgi:hypothetical protein
VLNSLKNGLASGLSAGSVKVLLAPFDTIKTLQQHSQKSIEPLTIAGAAAELLKRGGVGQLYSGIGVTVLGSMPSVGLYFSVYHFVKQRGTRAIKKLQEKRPEEQRMLSDTALTTLNVVMAAGIGTWIAYLMRHSFSLTSH